MNNTLTRPSNLSEKHERWLLKTLVRVTNLVYFVLMNTVHAKLLKANMCGGLQICAQIRNSVRRALVLGHCTQAGFISVVS